MRIGIVGSNWRPISESEENVFAPGLIILKLADGLVEKGHNVTLFAPKNTKTKANLISEGLNSVYEDYRDLLYSDLPTFLKLEQQYEMVLISKAFEMAKSGVFDIVHVHKTNIEPYFTNFIDCPTVITSHNSYYICKTPIFSKADKIRLEKYKNSCYYTALSDYIKDEVDLNFSGVVYNGVDTNEFSFSEKGSEKLLFAGRLIKSKGPNIALEVARKYNKPLVVIGDIRAGKADRVFGEDLIKKINKTNNIEYKGFVGHSKIANYFQDAKALLMPISEPEAFGITAIEAMSSGTPVIAYNLGALSEIIDDGVTGFLCKAGDINGLQEAVKKLYEMPEEKYLRMRTQCRNKVLESFTLEKMVSGYETVYKKVLEEKKST